MTELFYLSSLDLMIQVEYVKEGNSLRYAAHREMDNDERVMAEQYIMLEVAPKTDYFIKNPSTFAYLGADQRLKKKLDLFRQENEEQLLQRKEKEITDSVDNLINVSMRNYYTEKIGDILIASRNELKAGSPDETQLASLNQQMNDLLNAYNVYVDHKVTLAEIIPAELRPHWPGLETAGDFSVIARQ